MAGKGNYSNLPPIRDLAETLRDGLPFDELAKMYDVSPSTLIQRLNVAGYGQTGYSLQVEARKSNPLGESQGSCITGGGGGDYKVLPTYVVPHARRRKQFIGLDWTTSPASGPIWRWV